MTLQNYIPSTERIPKLRATIENEGPVRLIEAHNGLSALVGENTQITKDGETVEFEGFWGSSLTGTAARGMPDAEIGGFDSRMATIDEILKVTSKPMVVDGDTGGSPTEFEYFVRDLERRGASAVIIEDKTYPKRNSLDGSADQDLADPATFAHKIRRGQEVKKNPDFLIIARIESLIAGGSVDDAVARADTYIDAGVDGIMIHSKESVPDDILRFAERFEGLCTRHGTRPYLVCVPTTFNQITDEELFEHGFDIVIHANHLLRSARASMEQAAKTILENDRGHEAESLCADVDTIFQEVGFDRIKRHDNGNVDETDDVVVSGDEIDSNWDTETTSQVVPTKDSDN